MEMTYFDRRNMIVTIVTLTPYGIDIKDYCAICLVRYDPCLAVELLGARLVCEILFG